MSFLKKISTALASLGKQKAKNYLENKAADENSSEELEGDKIASAYNMNEDDSVLVLVDPENWYDANQPKRWYIIYHELGHDILNLEHGECGPMMKETANGNYSWDRLEKDKNTMFETYKTKS